MKLPIRRLSFGIETIQSKAVVGLIEYNTFSKFRDKSEVAYWTKIRKGVLIFCFFLV